MHKKLKCSTYIKNTNIPKYSKQAGVSIPFSDKKLRAALKKECRAEKQKALTKKSKICRFKLWGKSYKTTYNCFKSVYNKSKKFSKQCHTKVHYNFWDHIKRLNNRLQKAKNKIDQEKKKCSKNKKISKKIGCLNSIKKLAAKLSKNVGCNVPFNHKKIQWAVKVACRAKYRKKLVNDTKRCRYYLWKKNYKTVKACFVKNYHNALKYSKMCGLQVYYNFWPHVYKLNSRYKVAVNKVKKSEKICRNHRKYKTVAKKLSCLNEVKKRIPKLSKTVGCTIPFDHKKIQYAIKVTCKTKYSRKLVKDTKRCRHQLWKKNYKTVYACFVKNYHNALKYSKMCGLRVYYNYWPHVGRLKRRYNEGVKKIEKDKEWCRKHKKTVGEKFKCLKYVKNKKRVKFSKIAGVSIPFSDKKLRWAIKVACRTKHLKILEKMTKRCRYNLWKKSYKTVYACFVKNYHESRKFSKKCGLYCYYNYWPHVGKLKRRYKAALKNIDKAKKKCTKKYQHHKKLLSCLNKIKKDANNKIAKHVGCIIPYSHKNLLNSNKCVAKYNKKITKAIKKCKNNYSSKSFNKTKKCWTNIDKVKRKYSKRCKANVPYKSAPYIYSMKKRLNKAIKDIEKAKKNCKNSNHTKHIRCLNNLKKNYRKKLSKKVGCLIPYSHKNILASIRKLKCITRYNKAIAKKIRYCQIHYWKRSINIVKRCYTNIDHWAKSYTKKCKSKISYNSKKKIRDLTKRFNKAKKTMNKKKKQCKNANLAKHIRCLNNLKKNYRLKLMKKVGCAIPYSHKNIIASIKNKKCVRNTQAAINRIVKRCQKSYYHKSFKTAKNCFTKIRTYYAKIYSKRCKAKISFDETPYIKDLEKKLKKAVKKMKKLKKQCYSKNHNKHSKCLKNLKNKIRPKMNKEVGCVVPYNDKNLLAAIKNQRCVDNRSKIINKKIKYCKTRYYRHNFQKAENCYKRIEVAAKKYSRQCKAPVPYNPASHIKALKKRLNKAIKTMEKKKKKCYNKDQTKHTKCLNNLKKKVRYEMSKKVGCLIPFKDNNNIKNNKCITKYTKIVARLLKNCKTRYYRRSFKIAEKCFKRIKDHNVRIYEKKCKGKILYNPSKHIKSLKKRMNKAVKELKKLKKKCQNKNITKHIQCLNNLKRKYRLKISKKVGCLVPYSDKKTQVSLKTKKCVAHRLKIIARKIRRCKTRYSRHSFLHAKRCFNNIRRISKTFTKQCKANVPYNPNPDVNALKKRMNKASNKLKELIKKCYNKNHTKHIRCLNNLKRKVRIQMSKKVGCLVPYSDKNSHATIRRTKCVANRLRLIKKKMRHCKNYYYRRSYKYAKRCFNNIKKASKSYTKQCKTYVPYNANKDIKALKKRLAKAKKTIQKIAENCADKHHSKLKCKRLVNAERRKLNKKVGCIVPYPKTSAKGKCVFKAKSQVNRRFKKCHKNYRQSFKKLIKCYSRVNKFAKRNSKKCGRKVKFNKQWHINRLRNKFNKDLRTLKKMKKKCKRKHKAFSKSRHACFKRIVKERKKLAKKLGCIIPHNSVFKKNDFKIKKQVKKEKDELQNDVEKAINDFEKSDLDIIKLEKYIKQLCRNRIITKRCTKLFNLLAKKKKKIKEYKEFLEKKTNKCIKKATDILHKKVNTCNKKSGRSLSRCVKQGERLATKWSLKCKTKIHWYYEPYKKCRNKAVKTLSDWNNRCLRMRQSKRKVCIKSAKKTAKRLGQKCKATFHFVLKLPTNHKKIIIDFGFYNISYQKYESLLKSYNRLMGHYTKVYNIAIPKNLKNDKMYKGDSSKNRCKSGYRLGFKLGQNWATISRINRKKNANFRCVKSWMKTKKNVYNICALNGVMDGFKKYYTIINNKKALNAFQDRNILRINNRRNNAGFYGNSQIL